MIDITETLLLYLEKAEKLAGEYSGGYSYHFLSAEEFHAALSASIKKFRNGDKEQINILNSWFAPTSTWDDYIGFEGQDLANVIFELLSELKKPNTASGK